MTCRDEVLESARELARLSIFGEFTLAELLHHMIQKGTKYTDSTIRTYVTSRMCANAPNHHAVTYRDLKRTGLSLLRAGFPEVAGSVGLSGAGKLAIRTLRPPI